mmetsp:Transcript_5143/g.10600  ORF Transcript_5143/g.10600 Transcript_5143/m.10600 type:complete len:251 (+) Transcript_5143:1083-1835(+)
MGCPPLFVGLPLGIPLHPIVLSVPFLHRRPRPSPKQIRHQHHHRLTLERDLVRQGPRILRKRPVDIRQQQHPLHFRRRQLRPGGSVHPPISVIPLHRAVHSRPRIGRRVLRSVRLFRTDHALSRFQFPLSLNCVNFLFGGGVFGGFGGVLLQGGRGISSAKKVLEGVSGCHDIRLDSGLIGAGVLDDGAGEIINDYGSAFVVLNYFGVFSPYLGIGRCRRGFLFGVVIGGGWIVLSDGVDHFGIDDPSLG